MYLKHKKIKISKLDYVRTLCAHNRDARLHIRINLKRKSQLKQHCKKINVSVNDFIDSLIGQALPNQTKDSGRRWTGPIEDMPLVQPIKKLDFGYKKS